MNNGGKVGGHATMNKWGKLGVHVASSSLSTVKLEDYLQSELKDQMEKVGVHPHSTYPHSSSMSA